MLQGQGISVTYYSGLPYSGSPYCIEAQNLFSRMAVQPAEARAIVIDSTIRKLKTAGIWDKLDLFYMFAATDAASAKLNWKSTLFTCLPVGTPVFQTYVGFTFSPNNYLNTTYNPATEAVNLKSVDASMGVWYNNTVKDGGYDFGCINSATSKWICFGNWFDLNSTNIQYVAMATSYQKLTTRAGETGFYSFSRRGSAAYIARYINGAYVDSAVQAAKGLPTGDLYVGCANLDGTIYAPSSKSLSFFYMASGLSPTQQSTLYNIINYYLSFTEYTEIFSQSKMMNSIVWKQETGFQRKNGFGSIKFLSPGSSIVVKIKNDLYSYFPLYSYLRVEQNDSKVYTYYKFNTENYIYIPLSGNNTVVEITEPLVSDPSHTGSVLGDFIKSVKVLFQAPNFTPTYYTSIPSKKLLFLGNSITVGGNDTLNKGFKGFNMLFRNNRKTGCDVATLGYGHGSISLYAPDSATRMKFVNHIDSLMNGTDTNKLVILLGTNDFAVAYTDTTNFKNWYSILLNDIHLKRSNIKIFVISPLIRGDETKTGSRKATLPQYRDIIRRVCLGRSYVTYLDGYPLLTVTDLYSDQLHPSTAGFLKLYNDLKARSFFVGFVN